MVAGSLSCQVDVPCVYKDGEIAKGGLNEIYYGTSDYYGEGVFDKEIIVSNENNCCATRSNWYTYPHYPRREVSAQTNYGGYGQWDM